MALSKELKMRIGVLLMMELGTLLMRDFISMVVMNEAEWTRIGAYHKTKAIKRFLRYCKEVLHQAVETDDEHEVYELMLVLKNIIGEFAHDNRQWYTGSDEVMYDILWTKGVKMMVSDWDKRYPDGMTDFLADRLDSKYGW